MLLEQVLALVERAAATLGLGDVFASVDLGVTSAPYLITMAVVVPIALGSAYLVLQRVAVLLARYREESVSATSLRTGQRYPPWWEGEPAGITTNRRSKPPTSDGGGASATNGGVSGGADAGRDSDPGDVGDRPSQTPIDPQSGDTDPATETTTSTAENDSNTRVYTPPKEELDEPPDPGEIASPTGADEDGATTEVVQDDDVADEETAVVDETTCWSCGSTIPSGSDAKYCPQCGEQIV